MSLSRKADDDHLQHYFKFSDCTYKKKFHLEFFLYVHYFTFSDCTYKIKFHLEFFLYVQIKFYNPKIYKLGYHESLGCKFTSDCYIYIRLHSSVTQSSEDINYRAKKKDIDCHNLDNHCLFSSLYN